jgi:DNA-binding LacI/PurR family transcriptional regulator
MASDKMQEMDLHLYEKVIEDIKARMESGELQVGTRLPPIRDLSVRYDCNYHTIRRAMKSLSEEGIVDSKKGSGTYIRRGLNELSPEAQQESKPSITVILISEETPFSNRLCAQLQTLANLEGLNIDWQFVLSLCSLANNPDQLFALKSKAILIPWFRETDAELDALELIESQIQCPIVTSVNRSQKPETCFRSPDSAGIDSYRAAQMSCEFFIKSGMTSLIMVGNANETIDSLQFRHRLNGFQDYCMDNNIPNLICLYENERPNMSTFQRFIEKNISKVGIICYHDDLAMRIIRYLYVNEIKVPEDASILGFNNQSFCDTLSPPLTSLSISFEDLAKSMLNHTLARINGTADQLSGPMNLKLHVRESCGATKRLQESELETLVNTLQNN